jgi:hypothetical protein
MSHFIDRILGRHRPVERVTLFQLSGGITSWAAARRFRDQNPDAPFLMVFADTFIESECAYRFLICGAADIAGVPRPEFWDMEIPPLNLANPEPRRVVLKALAAAAMAAIPGLHWIWDGRTPWEVFRDQRFIGNSRVDPCSSILKRVLLLNWWSSRFQPHECQIAVGLDWDEDGRRERIVERGKPWHFICPLGDRPWMGKQHWIDFAAERGLPRSLAYEQGLAHDNCGGGCVKAGIGHWIQIFHKRPEVYGQWESEEASVQDAIGTKSTMLKCRRGGKSKPLSLHDLRKRIEGDDITVEEKHELGGCACALNV